MSDITVNSQGRLVQWKNTRFVIFRLGADRGSKHAVDLSFQTRDLSRTQGLTETSDIGHANQITQPRPRRSCCDNLLLYEEEPSLGNSSYDITVSKRWAMTS